MRLREIAGECLFDAYGEPDGAFVERKAHDEPDRLVLLDEVPAHCDFPVSTIGRPRAVGEVVLYGAVLAGEVAPDRLGAEALVLADARPQVRAWQRVEMEPCKKRAVDAEHQERFADGFTDQIQHVI